MLLITPCIIFSVFKGWTGKGQHWGRIPWNVHGVLIVNCDYLKIKMNLNSPKPSSNNSELSDVKKKFRDLLLQKTSGASISVALGELRGRKWRFDWDFSEAIKSLQNVKRQFDVQSWGIRTITISQSISNALIYLSLSSTIKSQLYFIKKDAPVCYISLSFFLLVFEATR